MNRCPSCSSEVKNDCNFCPSCGSKMQPPAVQPTVTSPPRPAHQAAQLDSSGSSSDSIDQARFTPGTMLAERYRIVGLLGKGGMGEVYRADDLKLRQSVALKFLPAALSKDALKLERFHHEVRVARQVSHPNVCRVYDIGEANGQHFISMEYIDGEDLASVLRRMGKPSTDKAVQIARQLCAGLAAAHDKGVLHRDLKPHNVMVDGRGKVRITDFGLAGFVEDFAGRDVGAGTPAYMAPEQLAGREVSVKSDVYSLGLVLFELFTGKRLFKGATREQIERLRSTTPTTLSGLTEDIDPAVDRVIQRCLEREPSARPSSALAVAAALPGGDPLAAALAAGETPDPAMVAAAGEVGGLRPAVAVSCLLALLVGAAAVVLLGDPLYRRVPLEKPPQALAEVAKEIVTKLGHTGPVVDSAYGFATDRDYLRYIGENDLSSVRWARLANVRPPGIYFWYRQSPRLLIPSPSRGSASLDEPPLAVSGMANVVLDPLGRLIRLNVDPPQRNDPAAGEVTTGTDWGLLFAEARLDMARFSPTELIWTPPTFCDERAAWEGSYPDQPDVPIRIEAGAYRGAPTFFKIIGPWTRATRMEEVPRPQGSRAGDILFFSVLFAVIVGSVLVARRNLQLRRGDRAGANRLALVFLVATVLSWLLTMTHVPEIVREIIRLTWLMGLALLLSATLWLLYIAVEPYVRRRWPQTLITWSRVLAGRFRDPLVGRDILVGGLFMVGTWLLRQLKNPMLALFGAPPVRPEGGAGLHALLGGRYVLGHLLNPGFVWFALFLLFLLFMLRVLLRKQWLAVVVILALFSAPGAILAPSGYHGGALVVLVLFGALSFGLLLVLLIRFGLFALISCFFWGAILALPTTTDLSAWYAGSTLLAAAVAVALAGYGFHTALAGRPLIKEELWSPDGA